MTATAKLGSFLKAVLRKIIPKRIIEERGVIVRLGTWAGRIYARKRIFAAMGMENKHSVPISARSFLFVCFGNIMRSPMADALLKQAAAEAKLDIHSDSAGIHAVPGKEAHPWSLIAARELGIELSDHRAKLLTAQMVEQTDVVFAMDLRNMADLLNQHSQHRDKFFMLGAYAGTPLSDIADPYSRDLDATRQCYRVLQTCIRNLVASRIEATHTT